MRKIVPDPPPFALDCPHMLQDTLVQTSEYVICALSVARQSIQLEPSSENAAVMLAVIHEMETAHALIGAALMQVEMQLHLPVELRIRH